MIDRITKGAVVDYIDISGIFTFPVFNLADSLIFIGWLMLVISLIIYWRKESHKKKELVNKFKNGEKND